MCSAPLVPSPSRTGPLARLLADDHVRVAEIDPRLVDAGRGLFPEEEHAVARAVESRRQQYTAGRLLARQAWQELGVPAVALVNDEQRVPRWPAGVVGSITHTHGWCAAAVASSEKIEALGADVEAATALDVGLWERVCRPEERRVLEQLGAEHAGVLGKALFSAKESIYKALYPSVRVFLDFQSMRIELSPEAIGGRGTWHAVLQTAWGAFVPGQRFGPGQISIDADWILTGIALRPGALSPRPAPPRAR